MKPLTPATPHVIIMIGIPGSGKSTFAERFAETFQAPIINQRSLAIEAGLDSTAAATVSARFLTELLKTNRTIVYEGLTNTRTQRNQLARLISRSGYLPLFVWVQTESAEAKRRATKKAADNSQLSPDDFDEAIKKFEAPTAKENVLVISGKHTYASQLKIVLRKLAGEHRPSDEPPHPRPTRTIIMR